MVCSNVSRRRPGVGARSLKRRVKSQKEICVCRGHGAGRSVKGWHRWPARRIRRRRDPRVAAIGPQVLRIHRVSDRLMTGPARLGRVVVVDCLPLCARVRCRHDTVRCLNIAGIVPCEIGASRVHRPRQSPTDSCDLVSQIVVEMKNRLFLPLLGSTTGLPGTWLNPRAAKSEFGGPPA